jgi:hypothetical protein
MQDHASRPQPPAVSLDDLVRRFGTKWEIVARPGGLPVWTAEHRSADSRAIRYIVAHSPAELAAKLETAGTVEP